MSNKFREEAMSRTNGGTAGLIRREIASETNKRFLRSLPTFRLDRRIPARFQELLGRLEEAEKGETRPDGSLS